MRNFSFSCLCLVCLLSILSPCAAFDTLSVSEVPLSISSSVAPNIMLLVDTSGSMDNIIWAEGYDNSATYPNWGNGKWNADSGNVHLGDIDYDYDDESWGYNNGWKYLYLPDPVGGEDTRYTGNYLNYLFSTYPSGTDLRGGTIPNETRMQVAKNVAGELIANNTQMRFGVSCFYGPSTNSYGHGATISAACGSSTTDLNTAINGYSATTNTPLAEAYYEITRYFRGYSSYYHYSTNYTSPIQYRCQKNFVIAITDGFPTYDTNIPLNDPEDVSDTAHALPDWDGKHPYTVASDYPNFPQYSDGFKPSDGSAGEGASLFLDDMALFGNGIDLRHSPDKDATGVSFDDADFAQQNLITYTVGFATQNQMLEDAASYGQGQYYTASNAAQLKTALNGALLDIAGKISSSASVTSNSTRLDDANNAMVYQAKFNSSDWSGNLLAYQINSDGTLSQTPSWQAMNGIPIASNRSIYSFDSVNKNGIPFAWSALTAAQKALITEDQLNYLRGDESLDQDHGGSFRSRNGLILGDIIDSNPLYVGEENYGYSLLPSTDADQQTYAAFMTAKSGRTPMLYVGANDGMLHGFLANTGIEKFAYVPNALFSKLASLTSPSYAHTYYDNGSPKGVDAYFNSAWHTVVVSGLGAGGKAIFALDVTNPDTFSASNVLWEISNNTAGFTDLGLTYSQPTIVRLPSGKWAAIFGNGYNSANNKAVLYVVNIADGTLIATIDTGAATTGAANGLSTPVPVDLNGDYIVDYVYAGDLLGNLWKFDFTAATPALSYGAGKSLFMAKSSTGVAQPITIRPVVGKYNGNIMIFFGTGKYIESGDTVLQSPTTVDTFYGIIDNCGSNYNQDKVERSDLLQQSILTEFTYSGSTYRITSDNEFDDESGWYLDLDSSNQERVVSSPLIRHGRVVFTTVIPSTDPCAYGGNSWIMELDAATGSRLSYSAFDVNNDDEFDDDDLLTVTIEGEDILVAPSGIKSEEGLIQTPGIVEAGNQEYKYMAGSTGNIYMVKEKSGSDVGKGRRSWRQLK